MKKVALFYIILFFAVHTAAAQSIITIDVHGNGNAVWTMEKHLPLTSQTEIDDWKEYIELGRDSEQYQQDIEDFTTRINGIVQSAEVFSQRPMDAGNFVLSYDTSESLSGSFGVVRFSFTWTNFSRIDSDNILIGDVFSEGMILTADNVLVINIPGGYEVESVSPKYDDRDGNKLIWDGSLYRSFDKGEPAVVLSQKTAGLGTWILLLIFIIAGASVFYLKKRQDRSADTTNDVSLKPSIDTLEEDQGYEGLIEQILTRSGGQAHQSEIVKETGLSKSKISVLLTKMKEEGRIVKIRRGKENIIRLAEK